MYLKSFLKDRDYTTQLYGALKQQQKNAISPLGWNNSFSILNKLFYVYKIKGKNASEWQLHELFHC